MLLRPRHAAEYRGEPTGWAFASTHTTKQVGKLSRTGGLVAADGPFDAI